VCTTFSLRAENTNPDVQVTRQNAGRLGLRRRVAGGQEPPDRRTRASAPCARLDFNGGD